MWWHLSCFRFIHHSPIHLSYYPFKYGLISLMPKLKYQLHINIQKFKTEFGGGDRDSKDIGSPQVILQMCILPLTLLKKHPLRGWGFNNSSLYEIHSLFNPHDLLLQILVLYSSFTFYSHCKALWFLSRSYFLAKY